MQTITVRPEQYQTILEDSGAWWCGQMGHALSEDEKRRRGVPMRLTRPPTLEKAAHD